MEIDDDETPSQHRRSLRTSEPQGLSLPSPSPEPSSSSSPSRGSAPEPSSPQSLNKLKRKAPSSPSDTYEGFTTSSDEASESFNPHDDAKSLQPPSIIIHHRTGFSAESAPSGSITKAAQNVSCFQVHPESPLPESGSEEDEFEAPVRFAFTSRGPSDPGPRLNFPESRPSTSMEDDTRLFSAPLQLSKREPRTHIPPRKRRRNIVTQPCLNCHTSKHECDRKRPCQRCILLGLAGLCVYETDGPALTDDQTVDELTTRQIIAELGTPLPVGSATGRPHPLWADGDGDPCHPQAAILTHDQTIARLIAELEELSQSSSYSSKTELGPLFRQAPLSFSDQESQQPKKSQHYNFSPPDSPSGSGLELPKQVPRSFKIRHSSSPEPRYASSSYSQPVYPLPSSSLSQVSRPQNSALQVQSPISTVGTYIKEERESFDPHGGPSSFVGFTSLNPSTSSSVSQASTGPALNLHWQLLSYHVAQPNLFLHFDVAFPTHDIECRQNSSHSVQRIPLYDADLDKPAADKKLTNMTINFQRNPLQWDIYVKRDEGIRVRDVFEAIYSAFDIPLTPHEKSLIPLRLRAGCEEAFRHRCNLAPVLPIVQQRQGWKRVDALLHETLFRGLTQSKSGGDWTLNLSRTMLRGKQDSNIMNRGRLMPDSIALRYWKDLMLAAPIARHWFKNLFGDALIPVLETTASYPPLPQPSSLIEYLPPYPNQNPDVLLNFSNNDLFSLPLSAAFAPRTGVDSDIMLPLRSACRICNFARLSAILQHRTLCNLLNNISPLIPEPSSQDYTWVFFCKFVPLCALFDSPGRGPLPIIQLSSDRARLIERLEVDFENPKNAMSWFHGPSGTGKSVIAYTLANRCKQKNRLAGSFFFSRRHANCRSARSLVFALAYQLGLSQPQAKEKIISTLHRDPGIISPSRDLREQFARLLIEPLEAVDWRSPSRVFVIDAIDQCQDHVPELISLLTRLLSHLVDVGLHIFFTSRDRVGVPIQRHLLPIISDIALNCADNARDIRLFLRQSFDKIHRRHRLQCRKPWPPNEVLDRLADRVGPHFITGSVIVKFVDSPDHDPIDRMDLIYHLPLNPSSPPELSVDNFYKYIISTADDLDQAYLYLTIVANVVGMLSCSQLDSLLKRGPNQTFDMRFVLSQLSPLVHIPDGNDSVVQVCHESLCDFLFDPLRCGKQFIPEAVVHRLLAYSSLSIMTEELPNDSALCSRLSRLATESSSASLGAFDDGDVLCFAAFSPPEPLLFLSTLWHIMRHRYTGLTADSRTKLALGYFCCIWQILQHISLSTVLSTIDTLPAFRFLANIQSLPVLLAFPIFLAFESPGNDEAPGPFMEHELRIDTLDAVAEIVNNVHALKDQCRSDSGALDYACTHWVYHLSLAEWDDELRSILITFMRQKLQQWLVKAWCLQDFETCLRTLCEVRELCLTANPPIHFDFDAQRTTADMKAEEDEEKPGLVRRSIKDVVDDVDVEVEVEVEQAGVARRSIKEALEAVQLEGAEHIKRTAQAGMKRVDEAIMAGQDWLQTDDGKEWLWTEGGRDWLKTTTGQDWLGTTTGQDRLDTMAGRDWLKTTTGQDRLDTMAGRDWLNTTTGKDWSNTTAGRDWLNRDRALSVIFHPDKQRGERTKDTAETEVERKVAENDPYETAISEQDSAKTLVSPSLFTTSQLRRKDEQVDLSHGVSTGRGGCWTCRLRRKKCDERREDNSCLTCKRLRIDCLGWGTRRPPWMRDKKAVEDYKASIKAQLIRASLIRGQPLSIVQASAVASSSTSASSSSAFASRQFQGSASSSRPSQINDLGIPTPADSLCDPTVTPMFDLIPKLHLHNIYVPPNPPISPAGSLTFHSSPMVEMCFNPDFDAATKTLYNPLTPSMLDDGLPKGHIFYYFEHIRKLQYVFAGNSVANITYSLVLQHPQGPVANAISALASLHFSLKRIALGFEVPNPTLENSPAIRFYNTAHQQIYRNKRTMLSESDANAAIHMLNFSPLSGGVTDWRPMLDIASEWLVKTGITMCDDPKLMMIKMNEASQLALKATMWCDIMSTLTLQTTPKHLSFYRRLFRAVAGNWDLAQQGIGNESTLRMDNFTGCPYEILLGIAEISTLSCWKMQELRKESLSSRELIRRGDVIERHLRTQTEMVPSVEADQPLHPDLSSIGADSPTEHAGASTPADDTRRIVAQVFLEAAILYLHTVLNDSNPGVPEIMDSVVAMVQLLNRLPASNIDRCLVFPICLAGCLTDDRITREFMKARLLAQHDGLGNINQTLRVMETAWQRRDDRGGAVEWQDLLNIQRLLLV